MAKQDGIIPLKGTIDNLSFYKSKDGYIARKKVAIDPERLAKDPKFKRTREAMANFKKAAAAGKLVRTALRPIANQASDNRVVTRLSTKMLEVIKSDATNPRGKKNVIDGETELLTGFEFNNNGQLTRSFFVQYDATIDRVMGALQVKVPAFIPQNMISAPAEATHFQLHIAGLEVDFEQATYVVVFNSSEKLIWGESENAAMNLSVQLPANSTHPLFLVMGITFWIEDIGTMYALQNGAYNALAIIKVSGV